MADDEIIYIDQGDRTLEIDNRGPVQQRRVWPKSQRGMGVSAAVRKELEDRVETEIEPLRKLREEEANPDVDTLLPPVEDPDAVEKREKKAREQLDKANEARAEDYEESKQEAKDKAAGEKASTQAKK